MNNPLVQVDPGLFIWTIVTFLVLVALLTKFAWKPLLAALEERQKTIAQAVDDARKTREELERAQQDSLKLLAQARVDGEALVSRARSDAEAFRESSRQQAATDAQAIVAKAEREIQLETKRAVEIVRREAIDMSVAIAEKLLSKNVSREDNKALIDDAVKRFENIKH